MISFIGNTPNKLYIETPLLESTVLSKGEQRVFLKLENTQPSGSFKIRGISNLIKKVREISETIIY